MGINTGLCRTGTDKFYTKKSIVEFCGDVIRKTITIDKTQDLVIEPSAGNGSFIDLLKDLSDNYIFYDINPENENILKVDYLNMENPKGYRMIHTIGNPPFGRQSSSAIKFIKKSCEFSSSISFILPKSFKKRVCEIIFRRIFIFYGKRIS